MPALAVITTTDFLEVCLLEGSGSVFGLWQPGLVEAGGGVRDKHRLGRLSMDFSAATKVTSFLSYVDIGPSSELKRFLGFTLGQINGGDLQ